MKPKILVLITLCIAVLFSCSDGDDPIKTIEKPPIEKKDPFITLKKTNINFTNEGGLEGVLIESNVSWTAKSSASWCTVSPSSGNKTTESISLSAPANKEYDNRSCTVNIESGAISKIITVNQGENLGLLITQDKYELNNEETTIKVEVKANIEFEVVINDEWITKVDTRGLTTTELAFKIAKNETYGNRNGSIIIKQKDGNMMSTITIYQSQEDAIILSDKDIELSSEAHIIEVVIKTNVDYEVIIPENAKKWVTHTQTRALRTETLIIEIAENEGVDDRTATIGVKDKKTSLENTITIEQEGGNPCMYRVKEMGTLGAMLNRTQKDTITTMIIKGELNKADFDVMKLEIPNLAYLDLKDIKCKDNKIPETAFGSVIDFDDDEYISNNTLKTIILPQSITTIGQYAFAGCEGLTGSLDLPNGLTEIAAYAFAACEKLRGSLIFPDKLATIQTGAFVGCEGFTGTLSFPGALKTIEKGVFFDCHGFTKLVLHSEITTIEEDAFAYCDGFTGSLIIPSKVTKIGESAFIECVGLTGKLVLPDGLTSIASYTFYGCTGLTGSLFLPDGLTTIGEGAFKNCSGFTEKVVFPINLKTIGVNGFWECDKISAFKFPHTNPIVYANNMLPNDARVEVPASAVATYKAANGWRDCYIVADDAVDVNVFTVKQMGTLGAMLNKTQKDTITTMTIRGEINKADFEVMKNKIPHLLHLDLLDAKCENNQIPTEAFGGTLISSSSNSLEDGFQKIVLERNPLSGSLNTNISLKQRTASIQKHAALETVGANKTINTILLPKSVTVIGENAFAGCSGLRGELNLPKGLTNIEFSAFYDCNELTGSLKLPDGLTEIGAQAFSYCSGLTGSLTIPERVTSIKHFTFNNCSGFNGTLTLPSRLTSIEMAAFQGCTGFRGSLTIPQGVTQIEPGAFNVCSGFDGTLTLPSNLTSIGNFAFQRCSGFKGSLNMPDYVSYIGEYAFFACSGFTGRLNLPSSLRIIKESTFAGCSGFTGTLTIPDAITSIGVGAFEECSGLTGSLTIPERVTIIEGFAFNKCTGFSGTLTLPYRLTSIGVAAFQGCTGFKGSLTIPQSVTKIDIAAFNICKGFTGSLFLPDGLTTIGEGAFMNCSGFTEKVVFPISLKSISKEGFLGCDKIDAFKFPHTKPIAYTPNMLPYEARVEVPASAVDTYKATNGWKDCNIVPDNGVADNIFIVNKMGTLGAMLNQTQKDTITSMIIKGEINKADFEVMKNRVPNLRHLDLSDARCENNQIPNEAFGGEFSSNSNSNLLQKNIRKITINPKYMTKK